ncbi:maleylpyruvate isomerase family mycothiol-dependent enzyme [Streptomyces sp. MUM 2J]|uniref:maleylpyruvate isomerase family mycothiol-dependent enzyme n=1 Tax=Streptomyces sp. MUM 2J TaxID=2791987 RepID=UPI001F0494D3|nr:maleylpyruvate isomerase family mycothiol-dependent enzyme [Streptomyces sp. MUM 2J]MCH0562376.1 maleylpyruvate isomerase family mycothiol-dependent enzyme [Streptomyces sp. MUM 2J]
METAEFLEILDREGRSLADAAEAAGTDAKVPTCPGWQVRDLLRHTGAVHHWAASYVAEQHPSPRPIEDGPELDGAEMLAWYRDSHRHLMSTLAAAPRDITAWTFFPAPPHFPSPLAFWTRRQAHETAVHRYDAETARDSAPGGGEPAAGFTTALPVEFAVDGIDELLHGFHARPMSRVRTTGPRLLRVRATDSDAVWTLHLSTEPPVVTPGDAEPADTELAGPAGQLYLALWNRIPVPQVTGDAALAELWREASAIG